MRRANERTHEERDASHHGRPTMTIEPFVPRSGSRAFGAPGSSVKSESSTIKAYICRPGAIGIVTDHNSPSGDRDIGALAGFQELKSPTTETRCARLLLNTNCFGIGGASGSLPTTCRSVGFVESATVEDANVGVTRVRAVHAPRSANPTNADAAATPTTIQSRIDRPRRGLKMPGSASNGVTRAAAAAATTRRMASTSGGGTLRRLSRERRRTGSRSASVI